MMMVTIYEIFNLQGFCFSIFFFSGYGGCFWPLGVLSFFHAPISLSQVWDNNTKKLEKFLLSILV